MKIRKIGKSNYSLYSIDDKNGNYLYPMEKGGFAYCNDVKQKRMEILGTLRDFPVIVKSLFK